MTARRIHLAKTVTWRFLATFTTFLIAWAVTGDVDVGLIVGGTEAVVKMVLYYVHERVWYRLSLRWGPPRAATAEADGSPSA